VTIHFATDAPGTIARSTLTARFGTCGGLANSPDGHAAGRVLGSHKAKASGLNHGLAAHKLHVTQLAKTHRVSAVAQRFKFSLDCAATSALFVVIRLDL
jgi:hypothetical protein